MKNQRMLNTAVALAVLLGTLFPSACTGRPDPSRPQTGGLFRHRWWNYYQRALGAADDRNYAAARADLTAALERRDLDQRMARTYGMHFIDYFPHRELGVLHWLEGNFEAAEMELSRSLTQEPSAKARFYLDRVRKALIRQNGATPTPPLLQLPEGPLWTSNPRVTLKGNVHDPNYVSAIRINGQPVFLEGARESVAFDHSLSLAQGCHTIAVEAENLAGHTIARETEICIDSLGPAIVLERVESRSNGILISGVAIDMAGVTALRINGSDQEVQAKTESAFSCFLTDQTDVIHIDSRDRLGNCSHFQLSRRTLRSGVARPRLVAGLQLAGLFGAQDDQPPIIHLQDWSKRQTVYLEKVVLSGSVRGASNVTSLTINGRTALPREGPMVFFTHIMDLEPGPNTIILEARDAAGNRQRHTLTIDRKLPKSLLLEERLRLTVFAFEQKGRISAAGFAFQDDFIHAMVRRRRFQVVERQHLDLLLEEHKLSRNDLIDASTAIRLGNLAAAQAVVAGSLVETRTGIEIIGRVIDSETGDILCTVDVYGEIKTLPGLNTLAQAMALKLHREFPLVDGLVIDKQGNVIITDLTLEKLRSQRRILIYTEHPVVHPETGRPVGSDHHVLGLARITQADEKLARARLQPDADPAIQPRQHVITQ
jgi:TolB-like protein